jgi:RES domain-containing protein
MPAAWRLVRRKHAATAFTGAGAAAAGGRWNSEGTKVVYASGSRALAALEVLAHLSPPMELNFLIFQFEFPPNLVETLFGLPAHWRSEPPSDSTQKIGDQWIRESRSAVLQVPSAIIPEEFNYLFNPNHPDFAKIKIAAAVDFIFDPRLIK